jgi:hypothetical protein
VSGGQLAEAYDPGPERIQPQDQHALAASGRPLPLALEEPISSTAAIRIEIATMNRWVSMKAW